MQESKQEVKKMPLCKMAVNLPSVISSIKGLSVEFILGISLKAIYPSTVLMFHPYIGPHFVCISLCV